MNKNFLKSLFETIKSKAGFNKPPTFSSLEEIISYVEEQAAYVSQTTLYGYVKTRAGTQWPKLFNDETYLISLRMARWYIFGACVADLALFKDKGPISLTDISLRQNISLAYLEQIFIKLKNNNLVNSVRGAKGGYVLEKSPEEIKISKIISAVDEEIKTLNCKKESKKGCNNKSSKCITHNLWDQLDQHINSFFEKVKLQDLVKKNQITNK